MSDYTHTTEYVPDWQIKAEALRLAIESHGVAPGKDSDRCFTARAEHFEEYLMSPLAGPSGEVTG